MNLLGWLNNLLGLLIWVPSNPKGAERLPPGIAESDLYLHRLWGKPSEDLKVKPKYLVCFTVGFAQKKNVDAAVKKFSEDFSIVLFHYDGKTTEWNEFDWSKRAVHTSVERQTKWWYAKRFLHPDIVASYGYIFILDEDLGVQQFNTKQYLKVVKKYGLEISQPGLEPNHGLTWHMTKRRGDLEAHKRAAEKHGWCTHSNSSENLVGKGGYAEVYRGTLLNENRVAVKKLTKASTDERRGGSF